MRRSCSSGSFSSRSEEHTSELQSHSHLVCRLLLEKKKNEPRRPRIAPQRTTKQEDDTDRLRVLAWPRTPPASPSAGPFAGRPVLPLVFFFNDSATPEISPFPLPDALPI